MAGVRQSLGSTLVAVTLVAGAAAPAAADPTFHPTTPSVSCVGAMCVFQIALTPPPGTSVGFDHVYLTLLPGSPWTFTGGGFAAMGVIEIDGTPSFISTPTFLDGDRTAAFSGFTELFFSTLSFEFQLSGDVDVARLAFRYGGGDTHDEFYGEHGVVPEPMTMILLGSGLLGVAGAARRRRARLDQH